MRPPCPLVYQRRGQRSFLRWYGPCTSCDFPLEIYGIFDRYNVEVVSLAVLTGPAPRTHVVPDRTSRWGCDLYFRFPSVRLQTLGRHWRTLAQSPNPFAIVVMAHLKVSCHV